MLKLMVLSLFLLTVSCVAIDQTGEIVTVKSLAKLKSGKCKYNLRIPTSIDMWIIDSCNCFNIGDTVKFVSQKNNIE